MMKRKRFFAWFLTAAMLLGMLPAPVAAAEEKQHNVANGNVSIGACTGECPGHIITGISYKNTITVTAGEHTITLDGVTIGLSNIENACALDMDTAGACTLILSGNNVLKSGKDRPGIRVPNGQKLIIRGEGELEARGGEVWPGIGRNGDGNIEIQGGTINAYGGKSAAGIGGSYYTLCGTITINGGTVTATGGEFGPGIGNGSSVHGGRITINGGTVKAISSGANAAIGGGNGGSVKTITINGGVIIAQNTGRSRPIGPNGGRVDVYKNGGLILETWLYGKTGDLYSDTTITSDITIPEGTTVTIPEGKTLTIADGVTVTHEGAITNEGTINNNGEITGPGTIAGSGSINGKGSVKINVNITFDANGGSVSPENTTVSIGAQYGDLPTPTRNGYNFAGWYTAADGGTEVTSVDTVSDPISHTLYAHWTENKSAVTVTFSDNPAYNGQLTITAAIGEALDSNGLRAAALNTVDFYLGSADNGEKLNTTDVLVNGDTATLIVNLTDEKWKPGEKTITAVFSGSDTYTGSTGIGKVIIGKASNSITSLTCDNIVFGGEPNPSASAVYGSPDYTYSMEQDGEYGPWDTANGVGTWWVKAVVEETENYYGGEDKTSFEVSPKKEDTPDASIDDTGKLLTGLVNKGTYTISINGQDKEYAASASGTIDILEDWLGQTISIIKVGRDGNYSNSEPQSIEIPAPQTYAITVQTTGGGTATATPSTAAEGTEITLTATADSGYHFKEWQVVSGGVTVNGGTFTMPAGNVTVKAVFEQDAPPTPPVPPRPTTYAITVETAGGGTASASRTSASRGTVVTLRAEADEGWHFVEWQVVSGNVTVTDDSFTMPAGRVTVRAVFEEDPPPEPEAYAVTVETAGSGTASASTDSAIEGEQVTLTATPDDGWHFVEWQVVSGDVTVADGQFIMPAGDVTVKAVFEEDLPPEPPAPPEPEVYAVTVETEGGGTASASADSAIEGEQVTLTAAPDDGWHFVEWQVVSGDVTVADGQFTMPAGDVVVKAVFEEDLPPEPPAPPEPDVYVVSFDSQGGSAVSSQTVEAGGKAVEPSAPVRSGYDFGGWYKDSRCTTAWSFQTDTVTGDLTLYAKWTVRPITGGGTGGSYTPPPSTYTPPTYPPTVVRPSEGGTVTVTPGSPSAGDKVTIRPVPDSGYEVENVTVTDRNSRPVSVTEAPDGTYRFTQPAGTVTVEVSYRPVAEAEPAAPAWSSPFADVPASAWYHGAVQFAVENGLMDGYSGGTFGPDDSLTRAQLAQILYNRAGKPDAGTVLPFRDVPGGAWYAGAVRWAAAQGIVGGYGGGLFGPDDSITREQLAVMLWRYAGSPAASRALPFTDASAASGYALEALGWAVENGILGGYGDGRVDPGGPATRAQAAQMLKNFLER